MGNLTPHRWAQLARFAVVGLGAFVVDVGLFWLLTAPSSGAGWGPVPAKLLSAAVATVVGFVGNSRWVFAGPGVELSAATLARFAATNVAALIYTLAPLVITHDLLGVKSVLVSNLAANVVGVGVGSAVRYVGYRHWVFAVPPPAAA